jgi:hypothetical protein
MSTDETPREFVPMPSVGTLALDTRRNCVGTVIGHVGGQVQLRPPHGGLEWDVHPANLCVVSASDALWPEVREANARSTGPRL